MKEKFTPWVRWEDRNSINDLNYPGVYCIAVSKNILDKFNFISELVCIGMTNSKLGLKRRLQQFDNTIKKKRTNHGGADRFLYQYENYEEIKDSIYVSVRPFRCNNINPLPEDLRIMGEVTKCEYDCWAIYIETNGRYPKFNDMKNSPKYSLMNR